MENAKKKGPVLLVTAFEPFDGAKSNSSLILLEKLKAQDWNGQVVFLGPVPVSFDDAWPIIQQEMAKYPGLKGVIALGQAEGRDCLSLERCAVNNANAHIPDNYGAKPKNAAVEKGEPAVLWSPIPWQKMEKSPNWEQSYSAGQYVCNTVMYHLVNWARKEDKYAGFIHVPLLKSQVNDPALGKDSPRMDDDLAAASMTRAINFSLQAMDPAPGAEAEKVFHPFRKLNRGPKAA